MSYWDDLDGTSQTFFGVGKGGPALKNVSGNFEVRNAKDSNFANLTAANLAYVVPLRADTWANLKADFEAAAALSVTTRRQVKIAAGSYDLNGIIELPADHNLDLTECKFTRKIAAGGFLVSGTLGTVEHSLTLDLNNTNRPNDTTNTPYELARCQIGAGNVGNYVAGDRVLVYSNQEISGTTTDGVPGKRGSIRDVEAVTTDSLQIEPLWWNASVADNARVRKVNFIKGGTIIGGEFLDDAPLRTTPFLRPFWQFFLVEGQRFSGQWMHDLGGKAQDFIHCLDCFIDKQLIHNLPDDEPGGQFGYACAASGASRAVVFSNQNIFKVRHGFTTDRPFGPAGNTAVDTYGLPEYCGIQDSTVHNCSNNNIDFHKEGFRCFAKRNRVRSGWIGISTRAPETDIVDNEVFGCLFYGILTTVYAPNCRIVNNKVSHTIRNLNPAVGGVLGGYGIQVGSDGTEVIGNSTFSNQIGDILITSGRSRCIVRANTAKSGNAIDVGATGTGHVIQGNISNQASATGFFVQVQAGNTSYILTDQVRINAAAPYILTSTNGTIRNNTGVADLSSNMAVGTTDFDFGVQGETAVNTITSTGITLAGFRSLAVVPIVNTDHPMLDEFAMETLTVNIENIVDNVSFDLRLTAPNISWGTWRFRYVVSWS
jgi:hypothetical protein